MFTYHLENVTSHCFKSVEILQPHYHDVLIDWIDDLILINRYSSIIVAENFTKVSYVIKLFCRDETVSRNGHLSTI